MLGNWWICPETMVTAMNRNQVIFYQAGIENSYPCHGPSHPHTRGLTLAKVVGWICPVHLLNMTIVFWGSRDTDERLETVRKIKEAIRRRMIEDSDSLSRRKPSTASVLSTNSIHLGFPVVPGNRRRSFSYQLGRPRSKHIAGKQYSPGDFKTYSPSKPKRWYYFNRCEGRIDMVLESVQLHP